MGCQGGTEGCSIAKVELVYGGLLLAYCLLVMPEKMTLPAGLVDACASFDSLCANFTVPILKFGEKVSLSSPRHENAGTRLLSLLLR